MKPLFALLTTLALMLSACQATPDPASSDGSALPDDPHIRFAEETGEWVPLFNGVNLDDFVLLNGQHTYELADGVIVGTTVPGEPNGFLCTKSTYGDFILEFEVLVDSLLNSGVQFRSLSSQDYQNGRVHGYQVEIESIPPIMSGGIYDEARRAVFLNDSQEMEGGQGLPQIDTVWQQGEWNHYRVEAIGSNLRTWVNGVLAVAIVDTVTASGFIGLQVHQTDHPEPLSVRWRNLRIMEL